MRHSSARVAGRVDARDHAEKWMRLPPRERLVRLKDHALARTTIPPAAEDYYVGLLEGLLGQCSAAVDAEAPTTRLERRENPVKVAIWAEKAYENFHWGRRPDRVIRAMGPEVSSGETLCGMGELHSIGYIARKGDEPRAIYEHDFKSPRPLLTYQHSGCLIIIGGGYEITARGIVG